MPYDILLTGSDILKPDIEIISSFFEDLPIYYYDSINSTNEKAVEILNEKNHNSFLVIANEQTAGKGRSGKSFYSPKDSGVYFSVVIHNDCGISDVTGLTPMAAVAVVNCVEKLTKLNPMIKWVNDIYIDGKKVCGILVQKIKNAYVIGIGINITTSVFPDDLHGIAGSLGIDIDKNILISDITRQIFEMSENLSERNFMKKYREKSLVIGKEISYHINGIAHTGIAIGIDDFGGLIVEKNGKKKVLTSGEITVRTVC